MNHSIFDFKDYETEDLKRTALLLKEIRSLLGDDRRDSPLTEQFWIELNTEIARRRYEMDIDR
jgi:hypothetical protein